MTARLVLLAGALLAVVQGQLTEIERVCDQIQCADSEETEFTLTCGNSGERITKIFFASLGTPIGNCPPSGTSSLVASDFANLTVDATCNAPESLEIIEEQCLNQVLCKVNVANAIAEATLPGTCPGSGIGYTVAVECSDPFNAFGILSGGVIALIGFALGATVTYEMFVDTITKHRRAVIIGWACQFGFMPLVAYVYVVAFDVRPLVALGVVLTGSVPGGTTSNLLTYYAKGNVALSITMSVASTVCALFMLPLLLYLYGTLALNFTGAVTVPFVDIFTALLLVIIPVSIGVFLRRKSEKWAKRAEVVGSVLGMLFLLAALVLGIVQNPDLFNPGLFQKTWIGAAFFQPIGALLGLGAAKLFKLSGPELRAVVLETGVQNYTIAIALAGISFTGCDRSTFLTFILAASFWYIINSGWICAALWWSSKFDTAEDEKEVNETNIMP